MALIRVNGGANAGSGVVKEIHSFSVTAASNTAASTTVTLDEALGTAKTAIEITSGYNNSCATDVKTVSGTTVTIELRNYYSSSITVTGNLIVFE